MMETFSNISSSYTGCLWQAVLDTHNYEAGPNNRIYLDLKFNCYGIIKSWELRAQGAGEVYLDLFKEDLNVPGAYILMSKTLVTPPGPGIYIQEVENPIWFEPEWVFGYHFASVDSPHVIYEIRASYSMTGMPYSAEEMSRIYTWARFDNVMTIGSSHGPAGSGERFMPNIIPHIVDGKY